MQKGQLGLKLREVLTAARIVRNVALAATDVAKGRRILANGLYRLFGAHFVTLIVYDNWNESRPARVVHDLQVGAIDGTLHAGWRSSPLYNDMRLDPVATRFMAPRRPVYTAPRAAFVPDDEWERLPASRALAMSGSGDMICARLALPDGGVLTFAVHLRHDAGPATRAQRDLLHLIALELHSLHRQQNIGALGPTQPLDATAQGLTVREAEVLTHLLEGLSVKEAAARLNIKSQTAAGYVKSIYRHFNVHSRGELMSLFVAKRRSAPPSP